VRVSSARSSSSPPDAVARHAAERYSYTKILIAFASLADLIGLPSGLGGIMTTLLMELPHSRQQEYEGSCTFLPFFFVVPKSASTSVDKRAFD
jgi:hypothetical protein